MPHVEIETTVESPSKFRSALKRYQKPLVYTTIVLVTAAATTLGLKYLEEHTDIEVLPEALETTEA